MVARVAIIGAGGMGAWFARLLKSRGYRITVADRNSGKARRLASQLRAKYVPTNIEAALGSDIIILATPANTTVKVINEILPATSRDALICEICATKSVVMPALRAAQKLGIRTASIHPMFGPLARGIRGRRILAIRTGDTRSYKMLKHMLEGADVFFTRQDIHDKRTAVTVGLSHFLNMAFAMTVSKGRNLAEMRRFAGRTYDLQMLLAEAIAHEPETTADIHITNKEFRRVLREFEQNVRMLSKIVDRKDRAKLLAQYEGVRKALAADPEFSVAPITFERVTDVQSTGSSRRHLVNARRSH